MGKLLMPQDVYDKAKQLYMDYMPVSEISRITGIHRSTINNHVQSKWKEQRDLAKAQLFDELTDIKKAHFIKLTDSAIRVLGRALDHMAKQENPPTIREAKDAAAVMEALDKITRLDENKPTDIIREEKPITIVELREKMKIDPFADVPEAEIVDDTQDSKD